MFDPCFHQWQYIRWENAQTRRYYEVRVVKNLFEEWEVFCVWAASGRDWAAQRPFPWPRVTTPTSHLKKSMPDERNGTIYG